MREAAALLTGYLIGSVLPAYFLGRRQGVDLRRVGTGNPGATNLLHEIGWGPALVALAYDLLKGLAAMVLARSLGLAEPWVYAAGIAAIVGHRFPFYLGFAGGQASGTSVGLLLFGIVRSFEQGWLSPIALGVLGLGALAAFLTWRRGPVVGLLIMPFLLIAVAAPSGDTTFQAFVAVVMGNLWLVNLKVVRDEQLLILDPRRRAMIARARARAVRR